eukprot:scaffold690_cov76-Skeletonema_dohrnii-CCMP3373.AAC.4
MVQMSRNIERCVLRERYVRRRARHPQSQGGIERRNGQFKEALQNWMQENNTTSWAVEEMHIQRGIKQSWRSAEDALIIR